MTSSGGEALDDVEAVTPKRRARSRGAGPRYAALAALVGALTALVWTLLAIPTGSGPSPGPAPDDKDAHAQGVADDADAAKPERHAEAASVHDEQRPVSGDEALTANPLYDTDRLAPLPCPVPEVDVHDPESMGAFLTRVADCLDDSWSAQFRRAGLDFTPPDRVFWTEPGTSPCRDYPSTAGAFYCRSSAGIYLGLEDAVRKWNGQTNGVVYASLLAHEYGHHVQGEAGILEYYHDQRRLEDDVAARNAWTRRSELQANCLAGVFLGAVLVSYPISDADREALMADAEATADGDGGDDGDDERTHGSAANSIHWTQRGLAEQRPGACNTWAAEDSEVE